jgi:beta-lactamase regulating signal transducer with metallopeptidase domain/HEAT repeat protein
MIAGHLLEFIVTNAALATLLAAAAWLFTFFRRNPHVAAAVWLVVLLKLVTPPVISLPLALTPDEPMAKSEVQRMVGRQQQSESLSRETGEARSGLRDECVLSSSRSNESGAEPPRAGVIVPPVPRAVSDLVLDEWPSDASASETEATVAEIAGQEAKGENHQPEGGTHALTSGSGLPTANLHEEPLVAQTETEEDQSSSADRQHVDRSAAWGAFLRCLPILWMAGALIATGMTGWRIVRFRRLLLQIAVTDEAVQRAAAGVARRLGLRRCPAVFVVPVSVGPMVWAGSLRPIVLVPRPLWDALGEDERATLLAHELAHIVRRDHWVRRFEAALLVLYWWLPTAWLAVRQRERAAEICCDAAVLAAWPKRSRSYAEALFAAVSLVSTGRPPALSSGLGRSAELKERLTMIVHDQIPPRPTRWSRFALCAVACLSLGISVRLVAADSPESIEADRPRAVEEFRPFTDPIGEAFGEDEFDAEDAPPPGRANAGTAAAGDLFGGFLSGEERIGGGNEDERDGDTDAALAISRTAQVSREVRSKVVRSLIAVIENPDEPAEVRIQAQRSLGRMGRDVKEAELALRRQAERADTPPERFAAAEALFALGTPPETDLLWNLLRTAKEEDETVVKYYQKQNIVRWLDQAKAVPPTAQDAATVALMRFEDSLRKLVMSRRGVVLSQQPVITLPQETGRILGRLRESGEGVRRLVEAVGIAKEPTGWTVAADGTREAVVSRQTTRFLKGMHGSETPVRDLLLQQIAAVQPTSDEIALALIEALSSNDAGIRQTAAKALGDGQADVQSAPLFSGGRAVKPADDKDETKDKHETRDATPPAAAEPEAAPRINRAPEIIPPSKGRGSSASEEPRSDAERSDSPANTKAQSDREMSDKDQSPVELPGPAVLPTRTEKGLTDEVRAKMVQSLIEAADNPELPAQVRTEALRSLGVVGRGVPEAERAQMVQSLIEAADNPELPPQVRTEALRSLSIVGRGVPEAERKLHTMAEQAETPEEKLAVAEVLVAIDSAKATKLLWNVLEMTEDPSILFEVVRQLDRIGAVPQAIASVRRLTVVAAFEQGGAARPTEIDGHQLWPPQKAPHREAESLLIRLVDSSQGIRLLVEAIVASEELVKYQLFEVQLLFATKYLVRSLPDKVDHLERFVVRTYGTMTPIRNLMLARLRQTKPTRDEVALALLELLKHDDPDISRAAAQALRNPAAQPSTR